MPSSDRRGVSRCPPRLPTGGAIDGWRQSPRTSARLRGRWTAPVGRIAARGYWRPVLSNGLRGASAHGLGPRLVAGATGHPHSTVWKSFTATASHAPPGGHETRHARVPGDRSCRTASRRRVTAHRRHKSGPTAPVRAIAMPTRATVPARTRFHVLTRPSAPPPALSFCADSAPRTPPLPGGRDSPNASRASGFCKHTSSSRSLPGRAAATGQSRQRRTIAQHGPSALSAVAGAA